MEATGGIESHVVEFCTRLAQHAQAVTLLCSRYALHPDAEKRLRRAGVELRVNRRPWVGQTAARKWFWTLASLIGLTHQRFAVVYTNGQGRNPALVQAWFRGRVRCVHHHHTACDDGDIAKWPRSYRTAMARADSLVVCADYIRPRMCSALGRPDVAAIYCFSRPITIEPEKHRHERVTFGYFGRLIREKGIDSIIRLSHDPRLAPIQWRIWGAEETYHAADFVAHPNVVYGGAFSDEAGLRGVLEQLDCVCLFSTHPEGLPISLMETMSAGRPWIATPQGGIPELVHDPDSCVLADITDYESLVTACVAMHDRIVKGRLNAARQRAFYETRLSPQVLLSRWLALLGLQSLQ